MRDLEAERDRLIDYWYDCDQHFDSEVLKRIHEIDKILNMEKLTGKWVFKRRWSSLVLYVEVQNEGGLTRWRKAREEDLAHLETLTF